MIEAKVICDSISRQGIRLTTMALRYPKFIHGEFMTHRVFSRNASSSRAIPVEKSIAEARSDELRASPIFWGKNQKGMQAVEELSAVLDDLDLDFKPKDYYVADFPFVASSPMSRAKNEWKRAAEQACWAAEAMAKAGAHKQITNRILEPFLHINVLVTATEYDNFFGLRLHSGAQPEMRALAHAMWEARKASTPTLLKPGEWHLPFMEDRRGPWTEGVDDVMGRAVCISVARCARVSYLSFETGKPSTVEEDLALYDRLMAGKPLHASPAEHQATPDEWLPGQFTGIEHWQNRHQHANFKGWRQYRKMLSDEAIAPLPEEYR